jgi:hypothetical protein
LITFFALGSGPDRNNERVSFRERLEFTARGERLIRIISTGGRSEHPDGHRGDRTAETTFKRLPVLDLPAVTGRCGRISAQLADRLPRTSTPGLNLHAGLAATCVKPAAVMVSSVLSRTRPIADAEGRPGFIA